MPAVLRIEAVCMEGMAVKKVDPRHKILYAAPLCHESKTAITITHVNYFGHQSNVHSSCACNEFLALTNRHITDRSYIGFKPEVWERVARLTRRFYNNKLEPCSYQEIIDGYSGGKKRVYIRALENLKQHGLVRADFAVKMFIKPDKIAAGDISDKAPRAIQYRSPKFNLEFGRFIKPIEHWLYPTLSLGNTTGTRAIVKGLNNRQRAELFIQKANAFTGPLYLQLDHSKFDSTVRVEHLRTTHLKYKRLFNARAYHSKTLAKLCSAQIHNRCFSKNGHRYTAHGTRMSGDYDTGCGNSVINGDALFGFLHLCGISKYEIMLDGDDSIVIIEQADREKLDLRHFADLGFETKCEVTADINKVEFCRSRLVRYPYPLFVRDPRRTISSMMLCLKQMPPRDVKPWLAAVGACELACNNGVPIISVLANTLANLSETKLFDEDTKWKMENLAENTKVLPISLDARLELFRAWGIELEIQALLEEGYTSVDTRKSWVMLSVDYVEQIRSWRSQYESLVESSSGCWWCSG